MVRVRKLLKKSRIKEASVSLFLFSFSFFGTAQFLLNYANEFLKSFLMKINDINKLDFFSLQKVSCFN